MQCLSLLPILQVLGDIREAFDVTKTDIIIVGKDGLLVGSSSPNRKQI
jgi:hypothetical protein